MNRTKHNKTPRWGKAIALVLLASWMLIPSLTSGVQAQSKWRAKWNEHKNADPLVVSGTLGTSMSQQWSNNEYSSSPFAFAAYANLNFNIYGFSVPLNFNFLDVSLANMWNDIKSTIPQPTISLGIRPELGKWRLHAGYSTMSFNNYVYSGMEFIGGGIEYTGILHFSTFAGLLNRPTRYRELDTRSALQQYADSLLGLNTYETKKPQFRRDAIGAKVGIGSSRNYFDLMFLKAKDDASTLPLMIPSGDSTIHRDSVVNPKENLAMGVSGRISIGKWFTLAVNGGASIYTPNTAKDSIDANSLLDFFGTDSATKAEIMEYAKKIYAVMPIYGNTEIRLAGDASTQFTFKHFNLGGQYRIIQAGYTSLGIYSNQQNLQSLAVTGGMNLFRNHLTLNGAAYGQQDNLDGQQLFTNNVNTYNLNINAIFSQNLSLAAMGNMIEQIQHDGLIEADPTTRVDQTTLNATCSPTYSFSGKFDHDISLNLAYISTINNNPELTSDIDSKTSSIGASYQMDLQESGISVNGTYDYSKSFSSYSNYISNTIGLGCNYRILQNDIHTLSVNANGSLGFNNILDQGDPDEVKSMEDRMGTVKSSTYEVITMQTTTYDISLSANWNAKTGHNASLRASLRNYSNRELIAQKVTTTMNATVSLSYSYSFGRKLIAKKDADGQDATPTLATK